MEDQISEDEDPYKRTIISIHSSNGEKNSILYVLIGIELYVFYP